MNCYVCGSESFMSRYDLNPKSEVCICKECGNIQHKYDLSKENELLNFYRNDYRTLPSTINLITTTRKLNYIKPFLADLLKDKKGLTTCDIGCATGYLVNFLKQLGHKATGTEYTTTYRRFAEHYYGIPITEDIKTKHKYDLISLYHVLEHMQAPDIKLKKYRECLSDEGLMFISVPQWLYVIEDLAAYNNLCIENYFHKNHICCFTEQSFKNLLNAAGLEIVKWDTVSYGMTVLAKRCEPKPIIKEDYKIINQQIDTIKKAIHLFKQGKADEAKDLYPIFPDAWSNIIFDKYRKDEGRQSDLFEEAGKYVGDTCAYRLARATWHYQFERYAEALEDYEYCGIHKLDENLLMYMGFCLSALGSKVEAMNMFGRAATLNPQKWQEANEHICKLASSMPSWDEVAREKLKEELLKKHQQDQVNGNKKG